ncbi:NAD-dependent epimerase/dehydratase family protein [Fibrella forsythiae]|uniref:NAD-dependent epimerase/dehydratase family protein n=1 Tax=Fibrella forsythiae TaxID=2817061 RepID=A0ABS3JFP1_9BACT|nr:NAD-dependent epimerase/dehydratase family protein [Fibrella forsythiae]MBO0948807.1 NAD-dependent epimerase/dehydratase family protein [Fibrella forsythiae]
MTSSLPNSTLVTGATGLIGSHVVRYLLSLGRPVSALYRAGNGYGLLTDIASQITWLDGDVLDIPSLETAITPGGDVIHCAAIVSFVPKDRARMEQVNVEGTANIVNVCLMRGVRKLAYLSSVAALGRPESKSNVPGQPVVLTEDQKWEESPLNSAYAKTKYRAELEVWRGSAEGLPVVMVNPSVVLGEGDWTRSSTQLIKYVHDENRFYTEGDINYVDVLDVAEAIVKLLHSEVVDERFILNAGAMSYQDFLSKLAQAMGKRPPSIRVPPALAKVMASAEAVRSFITGTSPLITQETARGASHRYYYPGERITQSIDFQYRPLNVTLTRIASQVKHRESI